MALSIENSEIHSFVNNYKSSAPKIPKNNAGLINDPKKEKAGKILPAPSNFSFLINDDRVIFDWDSVKGATTYKIERSNDEHFSTYTTVYNDKITSFSDIGLLPTTQYYYKLSCVANDMTSNSEIVNCLTFTKLDTGTLTSSSVTATGTTLNWTKITNATGYIVEQSTTSNFSSKTTIYTGSLLTYVVTGLIPATTYYYRVYSTAVGYNLKNYTNMNVTTSNLLAPTNFAGTAGSTTINLTWSTAFGAISYSIDRSTSSDFTQNLTTIYGGTGVSFNDTGLTSTTQYYYRIKSVNNGKYSGYSTLNITTTS